MENQTKNAAIAGETLDKKQYQNFNPKATLLLNVLPADTGKTAVEPMKKQLAGKFEESPEKLLQGLLLNTEASAERTQFAKRKWQFVSLLTGMLLIAAIAISGWLYLEASATGTLRGRLEVENQSLREQINLAGSQITGLKTEMEALLNRNIELVTENAKLKSQAITPVTAASPKAEQRTVTSRTAATSRQSASVDTSRIDAMRKGTYSNGATKAELIAAMGEPDRVYNARGYEQLVYFGKKPGRFWLIGGHVVQVGG
jgi:regulator of replication initiation timing